MDTLCKLYQKGWKLTWLGNKFKLHHTSVYYYVSKYNLKQNNVLTVKEIKQLQTKYGYITKYESVHKQMTHTISKTYSERSYDISVRALTSLHDTECSHKYWIKKCSLCHAILESETRVNKAPSFIEKDIYNNFNRLVCSYSIAKELAKNKIEQESVLYWVYHTDIKLLQIKIKQNIPDKNDKKTIVISAFTTQELCKKILQICSNNNDLLTLAKISNKPNELACLLIKILKK